MTLIGVASSTPSSSIIGRSVGSDTTMTSACPFAAVRHEAVAQHQVGGNRAEQLVVDAELRQVDELEPIALGQPPRLRDFGRVFGVRRFDVRRRRGRRRSACRVIGVQNSFQFPVSSFQLPGQFQPSWKLELELATVT